jgi:hypothetical protein
LGGVGFVRERKYLAGPEGFAGGLIVNNKINSIIRDVVERWKLLAGESGQINSCKISKLLNNSSE